jgi:hypothetical protein
MRKKYALLAATTALFLISAGAAFASTVTIEGTITVTTKNFTGNAPTIENVLNISAGMPTGPVNFFTAAPAATSGTSNNQVKGTIEAVFSFTEVIGSTVVATGSLTQDATFQANYIGMLPCSTSTGPSDCIYWKGNGSSPTADGSKYNTSGERNNQSYVPSVTDLVKMTNGYTFDVNFFDAQDWNIVPGTGMTTTPLPAALPLFATGIGGLGLLGWRRKRKVRVAATD